MNAGLFKLKIAKPCHENWDSMSIVENGRHCLSCNKDVIDFSILTDDQIQNYFISNYGKEVCGRFKYVQLERIRIQLPSYIFQKKIPAWQKYLIVFLICFGSNLFSIDINIGNQPGNLYAQTHTYEPRMYKTKNISKNKKRKNKKKDKDIVIECTWGLTIPDPFHNPSPASTCFPNFFDENKKQITDSSLSTATKNDLSKNDPEPDKKEPRKKFEFVVPVPINLRKRNK